MSKARQDEQAVQTARRLRGEGLVALLPGFPDADEADGEPRYTVARTHALLSVAGRLDLITEARTRITQGEPAVALWAPLWAAELAEAGSLGLLPLRPAAEAVRDAEASPETRAATSAALAELRAALSAAVLLGGPGAARRILEARRG